MRLTLIISIFSILQILKAQQVPTPAQIEQDKKANTPVPFTLGDRDRLLKLEMTMDILKNDINNLKNEILIRFEAQQKEIASLQIEMNTRFEAQQNQLDTQQNLIYILIAVVLGQFAYLIWDRRTFMKPLEEKVLKIEKKTDNLQTSIQQQHSQLKQHTELSESFWKALRELAKKNLDLQQVLKQHNVL